jgi:hypothetical protein
VVLPPHANVSALAAATPRTIDSRAEASGFEDLMGGRKAAVVPISKKRASSIF